MSIHLHTCPHLSTLLPGKSDSDYDFIHRSTNDLSKAMEAHKSEVDRLQSVIQAWRASPEAEAMEK